MSQSKAWLVWKFGGTSVADADRLVNVANLICEYCRGNKGPTGFGCDDNVALPGLSGANEYRLAVVVSAMAGVTDGLQSCCDESTMEFHRRRKLSKTDALYGKPESSYGLADVKRRHFDTADTLLSMGQIEQEDAGKE